MEVSNIRTNKHFLVKIFHQDICGMYRSNMTALSQFDQKCDLGTFRTKPFN